MAAKLKTAEIDAVLGRVKRLVQRPRGLLKYPLSEQQEFMLWHYKHPRDEVTAYLLLLGRGYVCSSLTSPKSYIDVLTSASTIRVMLSSRQGYLWNSKARCVRMDPTMIAMAIGDDAAIEFVKWAREYAQFRTLGAKAVNTVGAALNTAGTVGQFARMLPELMPLMPADAQATAAQAQRESRLPAQWATFDRRKIHLAIDHLTRCMLMPEVRSATDGAGNCMGCDKLGDPSAVFLP